MYVNELVDLFLLNNLSSLEYRLVSTLRHLADDRTNSLYPLSDKTSLREFAYEVKIGGDSLSRTTLKKAAEKLRSYGVFKEIGDVWVLNPIVSY